jgi:hypothetical protein
MNRTFLASLFVLFFGLATVWAAEEGPAGKVLSIEGSNVKIEITGEIPSWARKGGYLRAVTGDGKLFLRGAKIIGVEKNVIEVSTTRAKEIKVGDQYTVGKGKASAGC